MIMAILVQQSQFVQPTICASISSRRDVLDAANDALNMKVFTLHEIDPMLNANGTLFAIALE